MAEYIIGIDQSTQGTKALLFDEHARLLERTDLPHKQKISEEGYISHDPEEIYANTIKTVTELIRKTGVSAECIKGIGISNQRETTLMWDRETGQPICDAIVWQCARAEKVCREFGESERDYVVKQTGIPLSPYFPAAKMAWMLQNIEGAEALAKEGRLLAGTVDSWLLYKLTGGREHKTDYSNASRTQLFNLHTLSWDEKICEIFGIPISCLPKVCDSNSLFGTTDLEGTVGKEIPIHGMLGDSHGALFGQGCHQAGMLKATYGTGSSMMMNIGREFIESKHGIVTSLAWSIDGEVNYVLEGNLNYTGAVISWLKDDLQLIRSAKETEELAISANQEDTTYLVPAFSGLGAPYWKSDGKAMLYGMNRGSGKKEIVKAALDCIAYQITDILKAMEQDCGIPIHKMCVDGGPTGNGYLMQFQSDVSGITVSVPNAEELSGIGAAYLVGITMGVFSKEEAYSNLQYRDYETHMEAGRREQLYAGWLDAVNRVIEK